MDLVKFKKWATPITIGTFIVSGISGVLMFLKINFGSLRVAHEWISVAMVIGVVFHIVGNYKPFIGYFKKLKPLSIISIIVVIGVIAFVIPGEEHGRPSFMDYSATLQNIPLTLAAQILEAQPESVKTHLESHGIKVADTNQTINNIAESNDTSINKILTIVFERNNNTPIRNRES